MAVKHATASTFVFAPNSRRWQLGLILHPLFGKLMIPGGHVEQDETPPEAAVREVAEEAGLEVLLVPGPAAAVPAGLAGQRRLVPLPWWLIQQPIDGDNHLGEPHWHLDHVFVGLASETRPARRPAHPFGWYGPGELSGLDMFEDSRILAAALFTDIGRIASVAGYDRGAVH